MSSDSKRKKSTGTILNSSLENNPEFLDSIRLIGLFKHNKERTKSKINKFESWKASNSDQLAQAYTSLTKVPGFVVNYNDFCEWMYSQYISNHNVKPKI